jgi:hypothetical protein
MIAVVDSPVTDASSSTKPESPLPGLSAPSTSKTSRGAKSQATRQQASTLLPGPTRDASLGQAPATVQPPPKEPGSLRIEIVSAVAEETLAVYAGEDVLISTRLDSAHLGEALHFDCPLSPGVHPLRVALYRADESLHMQKEGIAEIVSDGSNTLDIHVNRRSKLLIRKEAVLEVNWPNPHSAQYTSSLGPASTSSK